jgi:hypothetical protein
MNSLFLNQLRLNAESVICLTGNDRQGLLQLLAIETVKSGKHVLVISTADLMYPVEGNVIISEEAGLFKNLIQTDQPQISYIGKKLNGEFLQPFSVEEIDALIQSLDENTKLLVDVNAADPEYISSAHFLERSFIICTIDFILFRDDILQLSRDDNSDGNSGYVELIMRRISSHLERQCPAFNVIGSCHEKIVCISRVRNILDENILLPIARHLKNSYHNRIFFGNPGYTLLREIG